MNLLHLRLCLIIFLLPSYLFPAYYVKEAYGTFNQSYNSIGQTGLIHLPSGSLQKSGTVGMTLANGSLNELISIIATPFPWLEASFFYHRPRETFYIKQNGYLDKGFNLKFGLNYKGIDFALGLDDIAGTGWLTKEYLVASLRQDNFVLTLGVGTGKIAGDNPYENPISSFRERPNSQFTSSNTGGELDFNSWFKGPVGIFGGFEFFLPRIPKLSIKIESNPFDYNKFLAGGSPTAKFIDRRKKTKNVNYGISYEFNNNFAVSISEIKGDSFNLMLSAKYNFNKQKRNVKPKQVKLVSKAKDNELSYYQNILRNLEADSLFLQSAELDDKNNLQLAIVNNKYNDPISVFQHTKIVASDLAEMQNISLSNLTITDIKAGMEISTITGKAKNKLNPNQIGYIELSAPKNNTNELDFQTIVNFPEFFNAIKPNLTYRYGDPTSFLTGGLDLELNSEIKFLSDLYVTAVVGYQIKNTYSKSRYKPDSPYLQRVRTDTVKYLQNKENLYVNSLQLDKLSKIRNFHYIKFSAGFYEMMFGGYGIEYLWKPFNSNFSFGLNAFNVKQRDFKKRFGFMEYKTTTGHSNFIYFHAPSGITIDLSVGKYLAGDKGYTLDFSKRFQSGFRTGAYFTRTNISKIEFGEGSFDKGFYFEIPLNIFDSNTKNGFNKFLIQPLTRDGGAKLKTNNPLIYSFISGAKSEYYFYNN